MAWKSTQIIRDDGNKAEALALVIISVSRSTDIPAFYTDWFFHRLEKGVPALAEHIETFKSLVNILGKGAIIWRFDPLILTDKN